ADGPSPLSGRAGHVTREARKPMDIHTPNHQDDLSDVERRLSGWRPRVEGLDADAMLFAAGLAAGRRGRVVFVVSALGGLLAIVAAGLGVWALSERSERQMLVRL